jgi:hypothetical protein
VTLGAEWRAEGVKKCVNDGTEYKVNWNEIWTKKLMRRNYVRVQNNCSEGKWNVETE